MKNLFLTAIISLTSTLSYAAFDANSVLEAKNFQLVDARKGNCPDNIVADKVGNDLFLYDEASGKQLTMFTEEQINGEARSDLDGKQNTFTTKHKINWTRKSDYSKERSSIKYKNQKLRVTEDSSAGSLWGVRAELTFDCIYKAK
ncbi:MAG: hypothetical protein ACOYL6_18160 [Bacteriovoracaceae bacterium]